MSLMVHGKEVKISDFIREIAIQPQLMADLTGWFVDDADRCKIAGIDYETMSAGFMMAVQLLEEHEKQGQTS
ncbi:MAG: hypothetical protein GY856_32145 [bacterium]|nr:hypothetical protein [bacterium]